MSAPLILLLLAVIVAVGLLLAWWSWRDRDVDFLHRVALDAPADDVAVLMFDVVVPVLVKDGYRVVAHGGHTTILEHSFFPLWTILVAIFLFPVGLLALLARTRHTVVIVGRGDVLEVHGRCAKLTADFVMAAAEDAAREPART